MRLVGKPDPVLVRDQLEMLQQMRQRCSLSLFCYHFIWILAKNPRLFWDVPTRLCRFKFNLIQEDITRRLGRNNLLVKPRQIGGTVYWSITRLLIPAIVEGGIGSLLISQSNEYVEKHFRIIQRAWRCFGMASPYEREKNTLNASLLANALHTTYSNKRELIFDQLDSMVMVATAEVEESAQGPTLHHVLADEYSRWPGNPEATLSNVRGALVPGGTTDKNCTANGAAGPFFEDVLRAIHNPKESDAVLHFFPWWWQEEYEQALSAGEADVLEAEITEEELQIVAQMKKDLKHVAYLTPEQKREML